MYKSSLKYIVIIIILIAAIGAVISNFSKRGNFSNEMKLPNEVNLSLDSGANYNERSRDHKSSNYYSTIDFYNSKSNDTLTILEKFKTLQQSSEWSCGVASLLMVLDFYNIEGYNEENLWIHHPKGFEAKSSSLDELCTIVNNTSNLNIYSTKDIEGSFYDTFNTDFIISSLKNEKPIIIAWSDWGGHWQVIIGYDTMGTESTLDDVLIVADPHDTTDHNQDGYSVYSWERFKSEFFYIGDDDAVKRNSFMILDNE